MLIVQDAFWLVKNKMEERPSSTASKSDDASGGSNVDNDASAHDDFSQKFLLYPSL